MEEENQLRQQRLKKAEELKTLGIDLFPSYNQLSHKIQEIHIQFGSLEESTPDETHPNSPDRGEINDPKGFW